MPDSSIQIQIFVTGGTFDKEYNFINGQLYFKDTHLPQMFERGRSKLDIDIKTLMMVDSLDMTDADREIIVYNCIKSELDRIVITHGTDTMVLTAKALAQENIDKTIIITGAMVPYAFGTSSDGFFNLGAALAFAQTLPHGVYIAMNGRYYNWDNVRKNTQTGFFETLNL
ncbi:MAG TPA: asparaginase domain-containing protein [Saprospiraceae bacterium]|mgnify:CR=1 FL=1|nr:asparaginase [Saprospiraceae bacterium]HRO09072.1 asparaginase domain-containing protein [Saprospiraceae bacterium]HRO73258.1 asparaginase domain-containing protein [Saprospiraceae bacterium]HRP42419.1 asparaginase domain-containing protein [Saprospiraceae bacterium]